MSLHDILANIALAQDDLSTMEREESLAKSQPDLEWAAYYRHGDIAALHGRLRQAEELYEKARQVGERVQVKSPQAFAVGERAWVQALSGKRKGAIESANATLKILEDYNVKLLAGYALALAGENKKALDLAGDVAKNHPDDVLVQSVFVPQVWGTEALSSGDAAKAIELLKPANAYDKAITQAQYVRGLAYWKAGLGKEAEQEFQKVLALHGNAPSDPLMSFAHLGLGRAYALEGDSQKSRTAYQDFCALWKDADPDVPILKEAKAEYAKIQ